MTTDRICVFPAAEHQCRLLLWRALEELFPVSFEPTDDPAAAGASGAIHVLAPGSHEIPPAAGRRSLVFLNPISPQLHPGGAVQITNSPEVHPCFGGASLPHDAESIVGAPVLPPGARVMATLEGRPVWWRVRESGGMVDFAAFSLPLLVNGDPVFTQLQERRFLRLLPLVHWLGELCGDRGWRAPALRACFMFDDPNLHASTYGYIDFAELAGHAQEHNYHVSFATVPLDAWYPAARAAALFQRHGDRLSLLIHGNDHTNRELARSRHAAQAERLVAQALRRVARFESKCGVRVGRVMAAPHGACNSATAAAMLRLGIESACISRGSLRRWNAGLDWSAAMGLLPAEFLAQGFPVFPRYGLSMDRDWEFRLAAYLGQPVVAVGHHQDLAEGNEILAAIAGRLNRLGPVQWLDPGRISQSNLLLRRSGDTLTARLYSRLVNVAVPGEVRTLCLELPVPLAAAKPELRIESANLPGLLPVRPLEGSRFEVQVQPGDQLTIHLPPTDAIGPETVPSPRRRLWPIARRLLAESRDRALPILRRPRRRNHRVSSAAIH